ncbi:allantoinase [Halobacteriales archaeon SW_5_70_135]|nr:MAG: allantoinase [Halobacteriales archaeon SW_5_70_135]
MTVDLAILNGTVVTPTGRTPDAGVAVEDGRIAAVGRTDRLPDAERTLDADGDLVVPGLVDPHVHNRTPGLEHKGDWTSETRAAAAGGVTSVVAMPNVEPVVDDPERLERTLRLGDEGALVDFGVHAAVTGDGYDRVPALAEAGTVGLKVFLGTTVGEVPPPDDGQLLDAMRDAADAGVRVGFHEEDAAVVDHETAKARTAGRSRPLDHARARPVVAEREAIARVGLFAAETDCPVHAFHVSAGSAVDELVRARERGVDFTAEATPHHLRFTEATLRERGNVARVNPPLRPREERDDLLGALAAGTVGCVGSDHAPHTDAEKGLDDPHGDTWASTSGFVGLETAAPTLLTLVAEGPLTLEAWVDRQARTPARTWGLYPEKGSLRVGTHADVTVIDPDREWTLSRDRLHSKNTVTPFDGERFVGRPTATVVRGDVVYREGDGVVGTPGDGRRLVPDR